MAKIEENTVSSANQLTEEEAKCGKEGTGVKILFAGNSITLHGVCDEIGWHNCWGMAASSEDKDYVHRTMARVWELDANASFKIAQVALWERDFENEKVVDEFFKEAMDYGADIIIFRAGENVIPDMLKTGDLYKGTNMLLDKLNTNNAKIVITSTFWKSPDRSDVFERVANDRDLRFVYLSDLGCFDKNLAKDKFEHYGVSIHPGDVGMDAIAERIFAAIKDYV